MYSYDLSLLGLRVSVSARSLEVARLRVLRAYLAGITLDRRSWPVLPVLILLSSDDPKAPMDPRTVPPEVPEPPENVHVLYSKL